MMIHEAAAAIQAGTLTPSELLEQCLARIDRHEENVRAWVFVARDEAREQAAALTEELRHGRNRGPLHGIPIGVKDIFDVFDWPTAAGSKLWANSVARRDCPVVSRLRQAGAVLVGKTVTTVYASFDPPPTRNPWDVARTPGGSSSGSAAAVACGMCLGALASQTGGSITRPAAFCGVPSIKPTYGRIPVDGVVPLAPTMDHVGVMANCLTDLATLMQVISGGSLDAALADAPAESPPFERFQGAFEQPVDRDYVSAFTDALRRQLGAPPSRVQPPAFGDVLDHHRVIMAVEAAQFHEVRMRRHPHDYPPWVRALIGEGLATPATRYAAALEHRFRLREQMTAYPNVLLMPATLGAAPASDTTGDPAMNSPWSFTGQPTVSLPFAWTKDGMPLSIQLVGRLGRDEELLRAALSCEAALAFPPREVPV